MSLLEILCCTSNIRSTQSSSSRPMLHVSMGSELMLFPLPALFTTNTLCNLNLILTLFCIPEDNALTQSPTKRTIDLNCTILIFHFFFWNKNYFLSCDSLVSFTEFHSWLRLCLSPCLSHVLIHIRTCVSFWLQLQEASTKLSQGLCMKNIKSITVIVDPCWTFVFLTKGTVHIWWALTIKWPDKCFTDFCDA